MKLRLKGNTVRFRLTKNEVQLLGQTGYIKEQTDFFPNPFFYAVKADNSISELRTGFQNDGITLFLPETWAKEWDSSEQVSFDCWMKTPEGKSIYLLLEKDFKCLEETTEDQSDNYENPNKSCNNE